MQEALARGAARCSYAVRAAAPASWPPEPAAGVLTFVERCAAPGRRVPAMQPGGRARRRRARTRSWRRASWTCACCASSGRRAAATRSRPRARRACAPARPRQARRASALRRGWRPSGRPARPRSSAWPRCSRCGAPRSSLWRALRPPGSRLPGGRRAGVPGCRRRGTPLPQRPPGLPLEHPHAPPAGGRRRGPRLPARLCGGGRAAAGAGRAVPPPRAPARGPRGGPGRRGRQGAQPRRRRRRRPGRPAARGHARGGRAGAAARARRPAGRLQRRLVGRAAGGAHAPVLPDAARAARARGSPARHAGDDAHGE